MVAKGKDASDLFPAVVKNVVSKNLEVGFTIFLQLKDSFLLFQNSPKNLDPSYKMDLDLWNCLGRVKLVLQQNFIQLIQLFVVILEREKPCLVAK